MVRYFFLGASLAPLTIGAKSAVSFEDFIQRLEINLKKSDFGKVIAGRRLIDIMNIRALLSGQRLDVRGNYSEKELDEALLVKDGFPQYVFDFLGQFETNAAKLNHFSGLLAVFFREETKSSRGFLKRYFIFEREVRLVLTAMRAKSLGRDFTEVLQFEDLNDPFVAQILVQKDTERFVPPVEYMELKDFFIACGPDPWQQHKVFTEWKFARIQEMGEEEEFSIDSILSYMVCLLLVEDWLALDEQQGREALRACAD
ncbi:MAG: DUF2764 family protein [Anaplasmataceae bacterium]|nr:DUF2764 family protein [Anaplasmataceae bacterium]